jgi:hypothetical protein
MINSPALLRSLPFFAVPFTPRPRGFLVGRPLRLLLRVDASGGAGFNGSSLLFTFPDFLFFRFNCFVLGAVDEP